MYKGYSFSFYVISGDNYYMITIKNIPIFFLLFSFVSAYGMHPLTQLTDNLHENQKQKLSAITYSIKTTPSKARVKEWEHTKFFEKAQAIQRKKDRQKKISYLNNPTMPE